MSNWIKENKKLIKIILISIIAVILATYLVLSIVNGKLKSAFDKIMSVVSPIIIGGIMAYLCNPILKFCENKIFKNIKRVKTKRALSVFITVLFVVLILSLILILLIPNFLSAIRSLWITYILNYRSTIRSAAYSINNFINSKQFLANTFDDVDPEVIISWVDTQIENIKSSLSSDGQIENTAKIPFNIFSDENIKDYLSNIFTTIYTAGSVILTFFKNLIIGIFIAIYVLYAKESISAHFKRFLNAVLEPKKVRSVIRFGKLCDRSFGGFIEGKIVDSFIIGILSYLVFLIFDLPNTLVLATIIGVTNVIPIFGPIIGAIPCAFIVLLVEPEKTFIFVILIIIIQQIDGNIIGPKILGDKINMSPLSVLISIVVMGGLFGIPGMIIGVPFFSVAIHLMTMWIVARLRGKGMDTSIEDYYFGNTNVLDISKKKEDSLIYKIFNSIGRFFAKICKIIKNIFTKKK